MTAIELIKEAIARAQANEDRYTQELKTLEYDSAQYRHASREQWYYMGVRHGLQDAISQIHIGG
jgi:hypothetical protein